MSSRCRAGADMQQRTRLGQETQGYLVEDVAVDEVELTLGQVLNVRWEVA
jgi:hypothetical protein